MKNVHQLAITVAKMETPQTSYLGTRAVAKGVQVTTPEVLGASLYGHCLSVALDAIEKHLEPWHPFESKSLFVASNSESWNKKPRGSKYPMFKVFGSKNHTLNGFSEQGPYMNIRYLDPLGNINRTALRLE